MLELQVERWVLLRQELGSELDTEALANEYHKLSQHRHIEQIDIDSGGVRVRTKRLFVRLSTQKRDAIIYLGIYEIKVHLKLHPRPAITIGCIESGRHDKQRGLPYPGGGEAGFCFGAKRSNDIKALLGQGELFMAIILALTSLRYINPGDEGRFMIDYRQRKNGTLEEPAKGGQATNGAL
jgi:hypothetical protein